MPQHIRPARAEDLEPLKILIDNAFGSNVTGTIPHLLTAARLPDHLLYDDAGRLGGVVGLYPHGYHCGEVAFRVAGVGQVATDAAARGRGVMSALLTATAALADGYDFTWLLGDRRRYGHYGWADGGRQYLFHTFDKYLPAPPDAAAVHELEVGQMAPLLLDALDRKATTLDFPAEEVSMICRGTSASTWRGWALDEAWILCDDQGARVFFSDGEAETLALLLAHAARELRCLPGDKWQLAIVCEMDVTPLLQACQAHYWQASLQTAAYLRVGNLVSFLSKACRVAQPRVEHGRATLGLVNADSGQAATLRCDDGVLSVAPGAGSEAVRLSTLQLSELCFGLLPIDLLLPALPPSSPFRRVLPLPVAINRLFAL